MDSELQHSSFLHENTRSVTSLKKARTKTELLILRKTEAIENSKIFAFTQKKISSNPNKMIENTGKTLLLFENPIEKSKTAKRITDIKHLNSTFSYSNYGIHPKPLPQFSNNLERFNKYYCFRKFSENEINDYTDSEVCLKQPPNALEKFNDLRIIGCSDKDIKPFPNKNHSEKSVKIVSKDLEKVNDWEIINDSLDIVGFKDLKRSTENQKINFKIREQTNHSAYFGDLKQREEVKERILAAMKARKSMLILNRVSKPFRLTSKQSKFRTTGFLSLPQPP